MMLSTNIPLKKLSEPHFRVFLQKFSRYKNCLSDRRRRFSFDNLREYIVVYCKAVNSKLPPHRIEASYAVPTELVSIVRSRKMFTFSSDERTFNIESYFRTVRKKRKITYCSRLHTLQGSVLVIIDAITSVAVNDDIFSITVTQLRHIFVITSLRKATKYNREQASDSHKIHADIKLPAQPIGYGPAEDSFRRCDVCGGRAHPSFRVTSDFSCAAQQLNASQSTHRFSFVNHTIKTVNMPKCPVSSTQKFLVQQHITTSKHQANKQLNSKQRQLFLTQPTTSNVRSEFNIDLCRSRISADIPLYKLKNKVFRIP
ncbi:hypothetical protein ANN_13989 [Periplaneta americana]|uniref:Uncharacterized protein n=1 Tax=Periplaneta americana TaxID=6978 RepID=A0ABQ8SWC6_PERAM|nr:hypothetical protein ANN_13989 [Periplaneta americana]